MTHQEVAYLKHKTHTQDKNRASTKTNMQFFLKQILDELNHLFSVEN
jgi:hypothetical protein